MKHVNTLAFVVSFMVAPAAFAAGSMDGMDMKPSASSPKTSQPVAAEVRKIDVQTGKVTLKHGPIDNLGMPAMVMAFPVKERASLRNFKEGDAVSVTFDKVNGEPAIVDMKRR
ncbi:MULTISPECIES: copper-binding protein [unclassified Cupriavidus]|uniref:copper-binding protein n=1 Tax=Cupriavidus sp. H19C3 TaxID=3241603 RepID=UPI003BF7B9B1